MIGIVSGIVLAQNERAGSNPMKIEVMAQQFTWNFTYPNGLTSSNLRLAVDRPVVLELRARDVIHAFWVREFGQKQDAVPGIRTTLVITPNREGEYTVVCTELCGLGHAVMRQRAIVMPQGEFDRWLAAEGKKLKGPAGEAGAAVFEGQGCGSCHTFKAAGSTGTQGPSLDQLAASAETAGKPLEAFVRESILSPDAYIHPGFSEQLMPENYGELPPDQIDALVEYLTKGAGKTS